MTAPTSDTKSAGKPPAKPPTKEVAATPAPKPKKSGASAAEDAATSKRMIQARAAILKLTGKKTVETSKTAMPHVGTGSFLLDHLIGGTPAEDGKGPLCPGYPRRYITEIFGAEASGKTTSALEAVAEVQKLPGGSAMYLDFEHGLNQKYARNIGVNFDPDKLLLIQPDTMEEGWKMVLVGLKFGVDLIVIDSVAAMTPADELVKDLDKAAKVGAQASNLSNNLKKVLNWLHSPQRSSNPKGTAVVLINQTRAVINTGGPARGDTETTPGGKALKFYCHLRVKFTKIKGEFIKRKNPATGKEQSYQYGNHTQVKVVKSRIDGTNGHTTDIFIRYGQGIDNYYSLIESGVATRVIQRTGGTNKYGTYVAPSKDKFRDLLVNNPALFEEIKTKVLTAMKANVDAPVEEDDEVEELMANAFGDDGSDDDTDAELEAVVEEVSADDFTADDASEQEESSGGSEG
jgi:recombination protein RecA